MNQTIADLIEQRFGLPATAGRELPATGTVAGMIARRSMRRSGRSAHKYLGVAADSSTGCAW
jgi:hypothetical protein